MTLEELGAKVKAKYPEYGGIDDRELGQRIAAKYPEYQSQITYKGIENWASDVPVLSQIQNAGIGIGSAVGRAVLGVGEAASRLTGFDGAAEGIRKAKEAVFVRPFEKNLQTTSGQVGTVVGNVAPFFMTAPTSGLTGLARAKNLVMAALKDAGISLAQTGGDVGTGVTTGATSIIANRLLPGAGAGIRQRVMSSTVPGYVSDVGMGLTGQRGESREGVGAFVPGMGTAFGAALGTVQSTPIIFNRTERVANKRYNTLRVVQEGNRSLDRHILAADKSGIDTKRFISESDLLVGAVDETGTVNSKAAVENLNDVLQPWENRVGDALGQEGLIVSAETLRQKMYQVVDDSRIIGDAKVQTRSRIDREIDGLLQDYPDGNIPLRTVHDLKVQVNRTNAKSFIDPEKNQMGKTIGRALKEFVEESTQALDVKTYNEELRKLYAVRNVLEALNGKKVEGGRLGKHFASVIGTMVGGQVGGPLGAIAGAEAGAKLKGASMRRAFGPTEKGGLMSKIFGDASGKQVTISQRMKDALNGQSNKSGNLKSIQPTTSDTTKNDIYTTLSKPEVPSTTLSTTIRQGGSLHNNTTRPVSVAKQELENIKQQIDFAESALSEFPHSSAKELMRFYKKGDKSLSEVNYQALGTDRKSKDLDSMVTELGFKDMDEAQTAIDNYITARDNIAADKRYYQQLRKEVRSGEDVASYDTPEYVAATAAEDEAMAALFQKDAMIRRHQGGFAMNPLASKADDLVTKARKYKTADEFVKAQGTPVYHGTSDDINYALKNGRSLYFAESEDIAKKYIGGGIAGVDGNVTEMILPKNIKMYDDYVKGDFKAPDRTVKQLQEKYKGYDALRINDFVRFEKEQGYYDGKYHPSILVFPSGIKKIKTRSQLTDIWNKAQNINSRQGGHIMNPFAKLKSATTTQKPKKWTVTYVRDGKKYTMKGMSNENMVDWTRFLESRQIKYKRTIE